MTDHQPRPDDMRPTTICMVCASVWAGLMVQCLECDAYAEDMVVAFVDATTYARILTESDRHFYALYQAGRV